MKRINTYGLQTSTRVIIVFLWLLSLSCQFVSDLFVVTHPTPTPVPEMEGRDGMVMIFIPEHESNEESELPSYLTSYWIDKTEVTNGMYLQCERAGICASPLADGFIAQKDFHTLPENTRLPVNYVSWIDANKYCEWIGKRLPTEAEWEKAASGTENRTYPWGNQSPTEDLTNFDNHFGGLTRVGSFPAGASPYGVLDMAGNVWEYVAANDNEVILKGGGYFNQAPELTISGRTSTYPEYNRSVDFGFRCASD